ncbi:MAG TPA: ABC transporter permease [Steroidobacteraceae bacterium]|nr:ABC transporter permease [Steroidobacteraceae bacterium]
MNLQEIFEFIQVALTALWLNKMRSALTALGIIIGVASVIVMAAIGNGATVALQKQISQLGTNVLNVMPGSMRVGGRQLGFGGAAPLSEKDMRAINAGVTGIAAMSGQLNGSITAVYGAANWSTSVNGVHADYFNVRPWPLKSGRYFTADEVSKGAKVAILGSSVVNELFEEGRDPIGETVRLNNIPFEIIGVLTTRGQSGGSDPDDVVIVPISTARSRLVGRGFATVPDTVGQLTIRVADDADINDVQAQLTTLLRKQRRIAADTEDNFSIRNFAELLETRNEQQKTLSYLLATTAAMSLVVGGIGIMNIMLVSVTERTREIGLRMAVGARGLDVMAQFLTEAVLLCLAGGLIGLMLGVLVTIIISQVAGWTVSIGVGTIAMAIFASAAVGIIFGFVPAQRAARLNPIDALRYE